MFDSNYEMFDENQKRTDGKRAALERAKFLREKYTDKIQGIGKWGEECEGDKSPLRKGRLVKVTTKVNQPEEDAVYYMLNDCNLRVDLFWYQNNTDLIV